MSGPGTDNNTVKSWYLKLEPKIKSFVLEILTFLLLLFFLTKKYLETKINYVYFIS